MLKDFFKLGMACINRKAAKAAILVTLIVLVGVLYKQVLNARNHAKQLACDSYLYQIRSLVDEFLQKYGKLPGDKSDPNSMRHSWLAILAKEFYPQEFSGYSLDADWSDPINVPYLLRMPEAFSCPRHNLCDQSTFCSSSYELVSAKDIQGLGVSIADPTAHSYVFGVVEVSDSSRPWTKPSTVTLSSNLINAMQSNCGHPNGCGIAIHTEKIVRRNQ